MLKQHLNLKLSQKLSPQQIQLMKLIQLSTLELEQKIQNEIGENPALETGKEDIENDLNDNKISDTEEINIEDYLNDDDIPNYKTEVNNYGSDDENDRIIPVSGGISFHQNLKSQAQNLILSDGEDLIIDFLIGSIDESGYIRRELDELVDDLAFSQNIFVTKNEIYRLLKKVQTLDPPGVGARNLKECLIIQLRRKSNRNDIIELAEQILTESFNEFSRKHYKKLIDKYKLTKEFLKLIIETISKLNPKPGGTLANESRSTHIIPDFSLYIEDGKLSVLLNKRNAPELHVSANYKEMLEGYKQSSIKNKANNEAVQFIKQKLDSAKWFIDAINQRHQTLFITINAIIEHQKDYFLSGDEKLLKPMILKDIANKINMDISTVSRVANSKYIDTPYGIKLVKSFFSEGMKNNEGENISSIEIKNILSELISIEDKKNPLADHAISKELKNKGYNIARRTVAKYREQLGFPVARLRKEI
ncbi:MAG: RNA polymerase sigma-54 factor [Flavobacteriaceae bacterium]|nr:RNA polymerase sigma-54 factor [Flavobacteriaceae bacterium]MBQ22742.1 RNA polymerase sigma-54 factor [Flavobacteriales bacterium]